MYIIPGAFFFDGSVFLSGSQVDWPADDAACESICPFLVSKSPVPVLFFVPSLSVLISLILTASDGFMPGLGSMKGGSFTSLNSTGTCFSASSQSALEVDPEINNRHK